MSEQIKFTEEEMKTLRGLQDSYTEKQSTRSIISPKNPTKSTTRYS